MKNYCLDCDKPVIPQNSVSYGSGSYMCRDCWLANMWAREAWDNFRDSLIYDSVVTVDDRIDY